MTIAIELPVNLDDASIRRLEQEAREVIGVRLYRDQKLSHGQLAKFLGVGRGQVDEVLGRHGPFDEFTAEEISDQAETLRRLREGGSR